MVSISSRLQYACLAVLELSTKKSADKPTRIDEIASRQGIPKQFLVHILLQLKRAGILRSTRGVGGGYHLAKPPAEITVGDVIRAVEPTLTAPRNRSSGTAASNGANAVLDTLWKDVEKEAVGVTDQVTFDELRDRVASAVEYTI